jgi:hypothetical protein
MEELQNMLESAVFKTDVRRIAGWIGDDPDRFHALVTILQEGSSPRSSKAAWVLSDCATAFPGLLPPHLSSLVRMLQQPTTAAVRRNIVRILQFQELDEENAGLAAEACFRFLNASSEPVAVKAFSMTVLYNLTLRYPDLGHELRETLLALQPLGSPGIRSRAKNILGRLERMSLPD